MAPPSKSWRESRAKAVRDEKAESPGCELGGFCPQAADAIRCRFVIQATSDRHVPNPRRSRHGITQTPPEIDHGHLVPAPEKVGCPQFAKCVIRCRDQHHVSILQALIEAFGNECAVLQRNSRGFIRQWILPDHAIARVGHGTGKINAGRVLNDVRERLIGQPEHGDRVGRARNSPQLLHKAL